VPGTLVVTGAGGFLGEAILRAAPARLPNWRVVPLASPRRGGPDLTDPEAERRLRDVLPTPAPAGTALIHAAAVVDFASPAATLANAAMSLTMARWARDARVGFAALVSSVGVLPFIDSSDRRQPRTLYGLGKLTAEHAWSLLLRPDLTAVVRISGIVGWQEKPTLFWNRLLLAAARGSATEGQPVVRRRHSLRNYVTVDAAAASVLHVVEQRVAGTHLLAGRDAVDVGTYIQALTRLPRSRLDVRWEDDGGRDEAVYEVSETFRPLLEDFDSSLAALWARRPPWSLSP
jgi:nucleoside-diphosphate-sugar epimerase